MINLKDFKGIADDIMNDVDVTASLKAKTLASCSKKTQISFTKYLVPAACLLLIISVARFTGLYKDARIADQGNDLNINIMMATTEPAMESMTGISIDPFEEARNEFGKGFLVATYNPEGFKTGEVKIDKEGSDITVSVDYSKEGERYTIAQSRTEKAVKLVDAKEVSINGAKGYVSSTGINGQAKPNTELYWYINGVQYSVSGIIPEQEAVKIAESMK